MCWWDVKPYSIRVDQVYVLVVEEFAVCTNFVSLKSDGEMCMLLDCVVV